jgi:hypothetical protein
VEREPTDDDESTAALYHAAALLALLSNLPPNTDWPTINNSN